LLYRGVLADSVGQAYLGLLDALAGDTDRRLVRVRAAELFAALAAEASEGSPASGDAWRGHLARRILLDDNPFSRAASLADLADVPAGLRRAARRDVATLGRLMERDGRRLAQLIEAAGCGVIWDDLENLGPARTDAGLADHLTRVDPSAWLELLPDLAAHYRSRGVGLFSEYTAFRWVHRMGTGLGDRGLTPILRPDPITFDDLIGYEEQRQAVRRNTEHFLNGLPANNLLLYGERGTGKSSTVKALLHAYADRGLRLVEVAKSALADFPAIIEALADHPQRFVLFVDDLSFDENETGYAELKALLEGGVEVRPSNVVLYATSNRRHLVIERFGDRAMPDDEIHAQDTLQEKLSLADRFGVTIIFLAPDQQQYLDIVVGLARRRGLPIEEATLRRRALQWATWNNGRSGRTARQFVDDLTAELGQRLSED
jgi:predicted AAA+ superfamily ATPase